MVDGPALIRLRGELLLSLGDVLAALCPTKGVRNDRFYVTSVRNGTNGSLGIGLGANL